MGKRAGIVCLWLCGSVTTITWNCMHRSSPNWVCRYYLQLIKFWPSCAPGKGVCGGVQIFGSALLQIACSMCISLSTFFIKDGMVTWQQHIILAFKHSMIDFLSVFIHFNLIYKMTHHMCWVDTTPRSLTRVEWILHPAHSHVWSGYYTPLTHMCWWGLWRWFHCVKLC